MRPALATNSIILAVLLGSAAATAVYALFTAFTEAAGDTDPLLRRVELVSVPLLILQQYLVFLVRADYGFTVANVAYLLGPVFALAVNAAFALAGSLSVSVAFSAWVAGQTLGTLVLAAFVQQSLAGLGRPDHRLAGRSLWFGVKAHAGRVMLLGNYKLDQWLVGAMAGSRELGLYSIAGTWAETLFYLPTALASVQRPDLVRASSRGAARRAATAFRAAVLTTAPPGGGDRSRLRGNGRPGRPAHPCIRRFRGQPSPRAALTRSGASP